MCDFCPRLPSSIVFSPQAIADMAAARHVNGRGIGVLTGAFTAEMLEPEQPFAILENLADTESILKMMGLA